MCCSDYKPNYNYYRLNVSRKYTLIIGLRGLATNTLENHILKNGPNFYFLFLPNKVSTLFRYLRREYIFTLIDSLHLPLMFRERLAEELLGNLTPQLAKNSLLTPDFTSLYDASLKHNEQKIYIFLIAAQYLLILSHCWSSL